MDKYFFYLIITNNNTIIKFIEKTNNKNEVIRKLKKNEIIKKAIETKLFHYDKAKIGIIKLENVNYTESNGSTKPIKMIFGPIKLSLEFLSFNERFTIYVNKFEKNNNHLFLTNDFLKKIGKLNFIKLRKYFKKMIKFAIEQKLEKRLLAPKIIDQLI